MMATGHNADRNIVAVLGGPVRGPKVASTRSRKVRVESAAVTSAPYTGVQPGDDAAAQRLRRSRAIGPGRKYQAGQ